MLILRLSFLNGVAIAASLTVLLTVAAAVTLLPALLGFIGMRALSRRERRRLDRARPAAGAAHRASPPAGPPSSSGTPSCSAPSPLAVMAALALPDARPASRHLRPGQQPGHATTRQAYDLLADGFGPGFNGPLHPRRRARRRRGPARPRQPRRDRSRHRGRRPVGGPARSTAAATPACITVVPTTSPQSEETTDLVDRLRDDVLPRAEDGHPLRVHVGGITASYDDFADGHRRQAAALHRRRHRPGLSLLLLAFRSIGIPLKAAADERRSRRRLLRRGGRDLPVGLGQRTAGPRQRRARSNRSCR